MQAERDELARQLTDTRTELHNLTADYARLGERLDATTTELDRTREELTTTRADFAAVRRENTDLRATLEKLREELATERAARTVAETKATAAEAAVADKDTRLADLAEQLRQAHARVDVLLATRDTGSHRAEGGDRDGRVTDSAAP